jgi:hypothetical protein
MGNREGKMAQFTNTGDFEAFRTLVDAAFAANDYDAFVAAHTQYNITKYPTEEEFTAKVTEKANRESIRTALENGDYDTRKTLSEGDPILEIITTEAKFDRLVEMHTHQEQAKTIREELGLP